MLRNKKFLVLALSLMIGIVSAGCGKGSDKQKSNSDSVTISGSTSVGAVMEPLVEEYKKSEGKETNLEVQQIGSSSGIKNTIDGTSEIGMTSRDLKDGEKQAKLEETQIAIDGIAVITNKVNKVKDLTMEQIKDIYTGKITNWKEVGGEDSPIVVVSREDGSGTREGFETIKAKKYPILRPFLLVNKPDGLSEKGQAFIDYILSEDGQKIVEEHGFVSVK